MSKRAELAAPWPKFSVSASAASTFRECRRRFFWARYWSWGGWRHEEQGSRRVAYALKNASSPFAAAGKIVHRYAAQAAQDAAGGRVHPAVAILQRKAVRELEANMSRAAEVDWRRASKARPMLRETFYGVSAAEIGALVERAGERVEQAIDGLLGDDHLERLSMEFEAGRKPLVWVENPVRFPLVVDGVDVPLWVVPDLAYRYELRSGAVELAIVDWKTGREREEDRAQMALYGAWAVATGQAKAEGVVVARAYLVGGVGREDRLDPDEPERALEDLRDLVREIRTLLVDEDLERNEPRMDGDVWPQLPEGDRRCARCDFRRLCRRE